MKALELFRKWNVGRTCTAREAWMAGYAAGCHRGYRKGHGEGHEVGERERGVLLAALLQVYRRRPEVLDRARTPRTYDVRDDGYLLHKLLSDAHREQAAAGDD